MSFSEFRQFRSQAIDQYQLGEYKQVLNLIDQHAKDFPDYETQTTFWRICMLALLSKKEEAIEILHKAIDMGHWWSTQSLREDPDLASLQGDPHFESLVDLCQERHERAIENSKPDLLTLAPNAATQPPYPLLFAFHGRNSNAFDFAYHWEQLIRRGWVVALAQSSQIIQPNGYCWDDLNLSVNEAINLYNSLLETYPIDANHTILAGFSQGAGLAAWLATSHKIKAAGFISVAPYLRAIDTVGPTLPNKPVTSLRGYLITGGQDRESEMFTKFERMLSTHHIPYQRENHPELGHEFPINFTQSLDKAFDFILE